MSKTTIEHDEIRRWVSERGGYPRRVKAPMKKAECCALIIPATQAKKGSRRSPGPSSSRRLMKNQLAFLYEDETKSGEQSQIFKVGKSPEG